jgi:murein L,D-transpeptidase YafK
MTKKLLAGFSLSVFALLTVFVLNQFIAMPWENSELATLETPSLVVKKKARKLEVFDGKKLVKSYTIVLGFTPVGDKEIEGDGKTPEGEFYIFTKNANSRFFLSLGVSYPSIDDASRGLKENLISPDEHDNILEAVKNKLMPPQKTKLGGEIYIHGGGIITDWTDGCVALRNEEMKELFDAIPLGTSVRIEP